MGAGMTAGAGPISQAESPGQELEVLKAQSQMLAQQLAEIQRRIENLEKEGQ